MIFCYLRVRWVRRLGTGREDIALRILRGDLLLFQHDFFLNLKLLAHVLKDRDNDLGQGSEKHLVYRCREFGYNISQEIQV